MMRGLASSRTSYTLTIQTHAYLLSAGSAHPSIFTGKERDAESGNDYFGARYYASTMGRWLSPDWSAKVMPVPYAKLDDPQSLNLYSYVGNNPLARIDPDGHYKCNDGGSGDCQKVKEGLANIKESIRSGNLDKSERKQLKAVLKFYGKAGKDNGVLVHAGPGFAGTPGNTDFHAGTHTTEISFDFSKIDLKGVGKIDTEIAAEVAHEGEHGVIENARGAKPIGRDQIFSEEKQAYGVQGLVNKGMQDDSPYGIWTNARGLSDQATRLAAWGSTIEDCKSASAGCQ
jgi:RHS repeat-associated protein